MGGVESVRFRFGITDRSQFFVGTLEPRKNPRFLLGLIPTLASSGCNPVIANCAGWGDSGIAATLSAPGFLRSSVCFFDLVDEETLNVLYRCTAAFTSISLVEAFGLPLLEAMAPGCPVLAPANLAAPEVVGNFGTTVAGWSPTDWVVAIESVIARHSELSLCASIGSAASRLVGACRTIERRLDSQRGLAPCC